VTQGEPILITATYRLGSHPLGSPHARAVSTLLRHPLATELRVTPLSINGVATLAGAAGYAGDVEALFARSGGNPFLAETLIRAETTPDGSRAAAVIAGDLANLSPAAIELATSLAVAGGPLALTIVRELDGDGRAASELLGRGLALSDGRSLRLRHGLLADALLTPLAVEDRRARHRAIAEVLATDVTSPDEDLARHWAAAGQLDKAAPVALRAADRRHGQRLHASAVELYQIALAGTDPDDARTRAPLLERAAAAAALAGDTQLAQLWAGQGQAADRATGPSFTAAATWGNPFFQRMARAQDGRVDDGTEPAGDRAAPTGDAMDPEAALTAARAAAAQPAPDPTTDAELAQVSARLVEAQQLAESGSHPEALVLALQVAADAHAIGAPMVESDALLVVGYAGDLVGAATAFSDAAAKAKAAAELATATVALGRAARMRIALGDLAGALDASRDSLSIARRAGGPDFWGNMQTGTAFIHATRGEHEISSRLAAELAGLELPVLTLFSQGVEWIAAVTRGDRDDAVRCRDIVLPVAEAFEDRYFLVPMLMLAGRTHLLDGDPMAAIDAFARSSAAMWSPIQEQTVDVVHPWLLATASIGDRDGLAALRERADELARVVARPGIRALADLAEGLERSADGDQRSAASSFERAGSGYAAAERRPLALDAWSLATEAHIAVAERQGPLDPARAAAAVTLREAEQLVHDFHLGQYVADVADLRARLDEIPVVTVDPLAALDDRARTIVLLAAAGRTNREIGAELFIAEKTVRNVLTGAYATLGVQRRAQLRGLVGTEPTAS
jgi:DNA-binding CsgD family transcriptional regulator